VFYNLNFGVLLSKFKKLNRSGSDDMILKLFSPKNLQKFGVFDSKQS
jgi:hypothetical protein